MLVFYLWLILIFFLFVNSKFHWDLWRCGFLFSYPVWDSLRLHNEIWCLVNYSGKFSFMISWNSFFPPCHLIFHSFYLLSLGYILGSSCCCYNIFFWWLSVFLLTVQWYSRIGTPSCIFSLFMWDSSSIPLRECELNWGLFLEPCLFSSPSLCHLFSIFVSLLQ